MNSEFSELHVTLTCDWRCDVQHESLKHCRLQPDPVYDFQCDDQLSTVFKLCYFVLLQERNNDVACIFKDHFISVRKPSVPGKTF